MQTDLVRGNGNEFKPVSLYNAELDRISVFTANTSITEVNIGVKGVLALFTRTHPENELLHAGFHIDGARSFCMSHGLPHEGKVSVSAIIKTIATIDSTTKPAVLDVMLPLIEENSLDFVEFPATD